MYVPAMSKAFEMLVRLYTVKSGSMANLAHACLSDNRTGLIYRLKPLLLAYGIIEEVPSVTWPGMIGTAFYRIDHAELDRYLFTETPLRVIYERRIWPAKYVKPFRIRPKEWNHE